MPNRATARKIFAPLILALVVLTIALFIVTWIPLKRSRDAWRANRIPEAISTAEAWSRMKLWPRQYHQVLAAAYLSIGDRRNAQPHLDALGTGRTWFSSLTKAEVANRLFKRSRYDEFLAYDAAVRGRDDEEVALYRAAAHLAKRQLTEAEADARDIDADDVDAGKLASFRRALEQRKQGSYPLVVDRDGRVLAAYQMTNDDLVAIDTDFAPLIDKTAGRYTIESNIQRLGINDTIELTLDSNIQKAAVQALGGFRGALVAIDPRTNELLAVASTQARGPLANLAFEQQYEPGSVIKTLTGLNAVANGVNVEAMFPYTCNGVLDVDGRQFGDWTPQGHGVLPDFDEALAESCNVVFADIGLRVGRARLQSFMARAGFDGQTHVGLFPVPLGRNIGGVFNNFETALYAIGLEHETTTTLHLAMLATMLANRGVLAAPRLVRTRRSILGEVLSDPPRGAGVAIVPRAAAERIVRAMKAVVTRDRGTGRRAAIDGMSIALKTGTAGKQENGYHALIIAFAPADAPKIAFALVAEESGPAEFAGAKIARDFLVSVSPRLK
ncbi:MAG TPA: penicillin-binding transpeptidase domain-containing protein [Thermoanaerobaculia bacterium]|nr:penicillin-binding transpeptidase domain-containing protein [Thermoanaerobaculia bacterium]